MNQPLGRSGDGPLDTEPVVVIVGCLAAVVAIGLVVAQAFDLVDLTDGQCATLVAAMTVLSAGTAGFLRSQVYAPATVARIVREGREPVT